MANAKEYFRSRQSELYSREYQQSMRRHRKRVLRAAAGSTIVIVIACIALYLYNAYRTYTGYNVVKETKREEGEGSSYVMMKDMLICYSMDGISCYDKDYRQLWNQSYEMKKPMVDVCESYTAVCDTGGTRCYILNEEGLAGEIDAQLPIKRIEVASQGTVAVLLEDGDVNRINYYDHMGTLLAENKAPIEKNGYAMDISLSNDGMKLAVSYLSLEKGSISTKVAFYNFDAVGANEIDHLVSAQEYEGAVVPEVVFVNATTAVAFGDGFFDIFQGSEKPVERFKKEIDQEIHTIFYNEAYVGMVLENQGDKPYLLKVYDLSGEEKMSFPFGEPYEQIKIKEENVYLINGSQCTIYNFSGRLKFEGDFQENLTALLPLEEERMILVLNQSIQTIKLN